MHDCPAFTILNNGNSPATGMLAIQPSLASDAAGDNAVVLGENLSTHINLAPNKKQTFHFSALISSAVSPGTYFVVVDIDPANTLNESTLANNVAVSVIPITVT